MPKSLLVMVSGAIGIEFASYYRTMVSTWTVVEIMKQVMPVEDEEISAIAKKQLEKQGMKIMLEAKVAKVEKVRIPSPRPSRRRTARSKDHCRPHDFRCWRAGQCRRHRP